MVVTQELWEVVQQYQKYTQRALMKITEIKHLDKYLDMKFLHKSAGAADTFPLVGFSRRVLYLVENLHRFVELYIPQEGGQVLEQVNQQLRIHGPTLEEQKKQQLEQPLCVGLKPFILIHRHQVLVV